MTPAAPVDLAAARAQLNTLCSKVGLILNQLTPTPEGLAPPPEGTSLWSSDYAKLLFWPCAASDVDSIEESARQGQSWFDEVLVESEQGARGRPIDGYLVLALPNPPDDDAREDVRRLELSAQVCRKHLIWPSQPADDDYEPGLWRRVADVTVVGLPDAEDAPGADLYWPELDKDAQALWDRLAEQGVAPTVIQDEAV